MSIADKLTQIAENMQAVYEAGKAAGGGENLLVYATRMDYLFENAVFPEGYEITINAPNLDYMMSYMFMGASGVRKITMNIPIDGINHSAHSFVYKSAVEEIVFPDGIKLYNVNNFANGTTTLKSVFGRIDLSGSTNNNSMFNGCSALENVSFIPNTIKASFFIKQSKYLSDASIQSIIDGLVTVETTQTLTANANVNAKLTDEQKATITAKNWTLVY